MSKREAVATRADSCRAVQSWKGVFALMADAEESHHRKLPL